MSIDKRRGPSLSGVRQALRKYASQDKARILQGFFKTGPGEYGEGDIFIGVKVPETRMVARQFAGLPLADTLRLLHSPVHEERLLALILLIQRYEQAVPEERAHIVAMYLKNTHTINNWDLVDLSAPNIVGDWLQDKDRAILKELARSRNMWDRRIAIVSTHAFIRRKDFADTFRIAHMLLKDEEDLMHKATGWMLREVGKRDLAALENFLLEPLSSGNGTTPRYQAMPRTMLRYAIERFEEDKRQNYLKGSL